MEIDRWLIRNLYRGNIGSRTAAFPTRDFASHGFRYPRSAMVWNH